MEQLRLAFQLPPTVLRGAQAASVELRTHGIGQRIQEAVWEALEEKASREDPEAVDEDIASRMPYMSNPGWQRACTIIAAAAQGAAGLLEPAVADRARAAYDALSSAELRS